MRDRTLEGREGRSLWGGTLSLVTSESPSNTKALWLHGFEAARGGGHLGWGEGSDRGASRTETGERYSEQQLPGEFGGQAGRVV